MLSGQWPPRGLGLGLALLAAGCGGSPCRKACIKLASCSGADLDAGIIYRHSRSAEELSLQADTGSEEARGFTCNLSLECSGKDNCLAGCVERASCAALTGVDRAGAATLGACQAACERLDHDAALVPAGDGGAEQGACRPSCGSRQCGDDGCGRSCGLCLWPSVCSASGECSCTPGCTGADCAICAEGLSCSSVGLCEKLDGGVVLPDGGVVPTEGGVVPTGDCGKISYQGCCDGDSVKYCVSGQLKTTACSSNPSCGWSESVGYYDCGTSGGSDPSGTYPRLCP